MLGSSMSLKSCSRNEHGAGELVLVTQETAAGASRLRSIQQVRSDLPHCGNELETEQLNRRSCLTLSGVSPFRNTGWEWSNSPRGLGCGFKLLSFVHYPVPTCAQWVE